MKTLAIIPARAGSKGITHKNKLLLNGKMLFQYAIDAAKESNEIEKVVVATDDLDIRNLSKEQDIEVFDRSKESASDHASINLLIDEVMGVYSDFDIILLLQPTAPCRTGLDIDNSLKLFEESNIKSVVSVVKLDDIHPARMYNMNKEFDLSPLDKEEEAKRRQELKPVFLRNGCIYAILKSEFLKQNKIIIPDAKGYEMNYDYWLNIDDNRDLIIAESVIKEWQKGK